MRRSSQTFLTSASAAPSSDASTSMRRYFPARIPVTSANPDLWTRSRRIVSPSGSRAPSLLEITTLT